MILPSRIECEREKLGVVLAEIIDIEVIEKNNTKYLRLSIEASNFRVKKQRDTINLFFNGYGITVGKFLEFMGTNEKSLLIGQIFFCEIIKNQKGFNTLSSLFMRVDKDCLYFDPRMIEAPSLRGRSDEIFGLDDIFG